MATYYPGSGELPPRAQAALDAVNAELGTDTPPAVPVRPGRRVIPAEMASGGLNGGYDPGPSDGATINDPEEAYRHHKANVTADYWAGRI